MNTKAKIYQTVEVGWFVILAMIALAAGGWILIQLNYFLLGDVAYSLNVFNDSWKKSTAAYCTQMVDGCQKVSFEQQLLTTSPSGPSWQVIGSRVDVNVVTRAGAGQEARDRLVEYIGAAAASHVSINIKESRGGK